MGATRGIYNAHAPVCVCGGGGAQGGGGGDRPAEHWARCHVPYSLSGTTGTPNDRTDTSAIVGTRAPGHRHLIRVIVQAQVGPLLFEGSCSAAAGIELDHVFVSHSVTALLPVT